MKKILLVNGENYWQDLLPDFQVCKKNIQDTTWILRKGKLHVVDAEGAIEPDAILWRVGAIKPTDLQMNALNLIELAGIPCINSVGTLKMGFDRLSMLSILKRCGLPVIDFNVVTRSNYLKNIKIDFPFVVKAGNYHGGFGKILIDNEKHWQDVKDLLFITDHYITTEPYIDYQRDIRYLVIKNKVWAMSRKGKFWKANVETTDFEIIEPVEKIKNLLLKLQEILNADILAIDILEENNGQLHVVEYNDIPGLSGFSEELKYELAAVVREKLL